MIDLAKLEVWFVTGSQHLYGSETLTKVQDHAATIAKTLGKSPAIPVQVVCKPVMTDSESILRLCQEASSSSSCR